MATQILFSMASLLFSQILHRVEYIKSVIYWIVKQIILKIQILYLIHCSIKETVFHNGRD